MDKNDFLIFGLHVAIVVLGIFLLWEVHRLNNNVLTINQHPHPILRQPAASIEQIDETVITLADDIVATLRYRTMTDFFLKRSMPKGLAAPQVGISKKLIVCGLNGKARVLINPEILERKGTYESYEGCLSVDKGSHRIISRSAYVRLKYKGLDNRERILIARNEDAAMLEHEIDHLNGVLNIDIQADEEG
jgi:peptide deformylase